MLTIRLAALGILGVALAVSVAQTAAQTPSPAEQRDTLSDELQRCRNLRERAATDDRCQAAYRQNRERFLAPGPAYDPPPIHLNPDTPKPRLIRPDQPPTTQPPTTQPRD